jgi:hypothetical protein
MRQELLNYLTTATSTATIRTVSELPWNTAGEPLYLKNMKKFYLDQEQIQQEPLISVLPGYQSIDQNTVSVTGYFAVDAKYTPTGLAASLTTILGAKDRTGIKNFSVESDYTTEIQDDVLIYTVEYRLITTA